MMQEVKQTDKEKLKMYMKLSKKELAQMLIQANSVIQKIGPIIHYHSDGVMPVETHYDRCGCNPKNGGSGICGCTLGNQITYT